MKLKLKVKDKTNELQIENLKDKILATVPYDQSITYFANVVQWVGEERKIVDFESFQEYDLFTIEEMKR